MWNPWMKKNPFMSLWLSGANRIGATAMGLWRSAARRQQVDALNATTKAAGSHAKRTPKKRPPKKRRKK